MSDVEEQVTYHAIEHLDFDVECQVEWKWHFVVFGFHVDAPWTHPCKKPARWIGTVPCGHTEVITCDKHRRDNSIGYRCCGHRWQALHLTWRKL